MSIQTFETPEFQLQLIPDGDSFRVEAAGLARALGFHTARDLVRSIPDDEKGLELSPTPGDQQVWYVTEAGFYRALGQRQVSRIKDAAAREKVTRFQRWVYGDVLPSFRRTGGYGNTPAGIKATVTEWLADPEVMTLIISACAAVLAHTRWKHPNESMQAFAQLFMQPELPGFEQQQGITSGDTDTE